MKNARLIACGLLIAFVGHFLALMLAGAGHGWNTPVLISLVLWVAYPMALIRSDLTSRLSYDLALLTLALVADAGLVALTLREGVEYLLQVLQFPPDWWVIGTWLLIWLGWQFIAAGRLIRSRPSTA